jgi:chromosome segregation ATPase
MEGRARERYGRLTQLISDGDWYRDQYDALVEALRTDNDWLEYRLQIVRNAFLDQGAQATEDASVVKRVTTALLERDEALWKAREDLAAMRTVVAEWETEVASTRAQLEQDRATLEGAQSWQSQAKESAKEAEQLRVKLAERATALATAERQLQQDQSAR